MTTTTPGSSGNEPGIEWRLLRLHQFDPLLLYAMLKLRTDVFVVEQTCAYPELDGHDTDQRVLHLAAIVGGNQVAACLRILPSGLTYDDPSIGRVVVAKAFRGRGLADDLMRRGIVHAEAAWPGSRIRLGAQAHLQGWYERHGFASCSDVYLEDGIPHVDMLRPASAIPAAQ